MRRIGILVLFLLMGVAAWWAYGRATPRSEDLPDADLAGTAPAPATVDPASKPGEMPGLASRTPTSPTETKNAASKEAPGITGRVVDEKGSPVAGARVISIADTSAATFLVADAEKEVSHARASTTDAEGRFTLDVTADAPFYRVYADAPHLSPALSVPVAAGKGVEIVLRGTTTIEGKVRSIEGKPVAGAKVRALLLLDAVRVELEAVSDESGAYRIADFPTSAPPSRMTYLGYLFYEVTALGYAPTFVESMLMGFEPGTPRTVDFTLGLGASVVGKVNDADARTPIADATVVLWSIEAMSGYGKADGSSIMNPWGQRPLGETKSAADGTYRFEHVPASGAQPLAVHSIGQKGQALGRVGAWKSGYVPGSDEVPVKAQAATIETEIALWHAGTVSGRVVDTQSKPLQGVDVYLSSLERPTQSTFPRFYADVPRSRIRTDAEGRYLLASAPTAREGRSRVIVTAELRSSRGSSLWAGPAPTTATFAMVGSGERVEVSDIVLDAMPDVPRIAVRVLGPEGSPLAGAMLTPADGSSRGAAGPRTDAEGRVIYRFRPQRDRPLPETAFIVRMPGLAPGGFFATPSLTPEEHEVRLSRSRRIAGRVLLSDLSPASRASVDVDNGTVPPVERDTFWPFEQPARRPGDPPFVWFGCATTSADGSFEVGDLPEGPYHVRATLASRVNGSPLMQALRSGVQTDAQGVELVLSADDSPPVGRLEGSVVDAGTGRPVTRFQITVASGSQVGGFVSDRQDVGVVNPLTIGTTRGSGTFFFESFPAGRWTVTARAEGFAPRTLAPIEISAGETKSIPPIGLSAGTTLVGTAKSSAGVALQGRTLFLTPVEPELASVTSSGPIAEDGSFRIANLSPGTYRVASFPGSDPSGQSLVGQGGQPQTVPTGVSELRIDVTFDVAAVLSLNPIDPRLPPGPWDGVSPTPQQKKFGDACKATLRRKDGTLVAEQKGFFRGGGVGIMSFLPLVPGEYVLRWELPDEPPKDVPLTLEAGQPRRVGLPK